MADRRAENPRKTPGWQRIVLIASLSLNMAIISAGIGFAFRYGPEDKRPAPPPRAASLYASALNEEDRREIGRALFHENRRNGPSRAEMRAHFADVLSHLRAEPFDRDLLFSAMLNHAQISHVQAEQAIALLTDHLAEMSPEERLLYAQRLEERVRRGKHRGKRDHRGEHRHSNDEARERAAPRE